MIQTGRETEYHEHICIYKDLFFLECDWTSNVIKEAEKKIGVVKTMTKII